MQVHLAEHLLKSDRIKLGGYYTPANLVKMVHEFIMPYINNAGKNAVVFDSAGGCGAFLMDLRNFNYRVADRDDAACKFLSREFVSKNIFHTNSLQSVSRSKFSIPASAFLIMIGNPPYNDTTSEFKKGHKGQNRADEDIYDRDLGISFLRSYYKLNADVVCILHPLSYLIKEANFKRLGDFRLNYRLKKAVIFSSSLFQGTGLVKFPILVALYERNPKGMNFEYIRDFPFRILGATKKFVLSEFETTDGFINKYPPRKKDAKKSPIGLYYYSFRDYNSLKRNSAFMIKAHANGIILNIENFYKYAYLYALKTLFKPDDAWLYGNLSPLIDIKNVEKNKSVYVLYALRTSKLLFEVERLTLVKIADYYKINLDVAHDLDKIKKEIEYWLSALAK